MTDIARAEQMIRVAVDTMLELGDPRAPLLMALVDGAGIAAGANGDRDRFWLVNQRAAGGWLVNAPTTHVRAIISDHTEHHAIRYHAEEFGGIEREDYIAGRREARILAHFEVLAPGYELDAAPFAGNANNVELRTGRTAWTGRPLVSTADVARIAAEVTGEVAPRP